MPAPPSRRSSDPFEPTPVSKLLERGQPPPLSRSSGGSGAAPSRSGAYTTQQQQMALERDAAAKKQKERFLIFTRVLMKYLEQKDPALHLQVKQIIKDCAEKNRRKMPGYESVTNSMHIQLKKVVSENYWKRAEAYLDHFLKEKAKAGSQSAQQLTDKKKQQQAAQAASMQRKRQQQQQQQNLDTASSLTALQSDLQKQREKLDAAAKRSAAAAASKKSSSSSQPTAAPAAAAKQPAPAKTTKGKGGKRASSHSRKSSVSSTGSSQQPAAAAETRPAAAPAPPAAPPKTTVLHHQLMEQVDNATNFDWTVAGSILGQETQWLLTEEQHKLIYDSKATVVSGSSNAATEAALDGAPPPPLVGQAFPLVGWSRRNVISTRVAWARTRLREQQQASSTESAALGGGALPVIRGAAENLKITVEPPDVPPGNMTAEPTAAASTDWFNEETAEQDQVLAVLSEGAELYLKSVLEKALHCARQRQNVDGIRLWHQQYTPTFPSSSSSSSPQHHRPPPLSLRLGCDVQRQVAQAAGNAAATCQRMEEALERQATRVSERDRVLNQETLAAVGSMAEASLRPKLAQAVPAADQEAKRNFDVHGGRDAENPPFGRLPKKAKLEVIDFQKGMGFVRPGRRRLRAATYSSSFSY